MQVWVTGLNDAYCCNARNRLISLETTQAFAWFGSYSDGQWPRGVPAERSCSWADGVAMPLPVGDLTHGIAARSNRPTRQIEHAHIRVGHNAGTISAVDDRALEPLLLQHRQPFLRKIKPGRRLL